MKQIFLINQDLLKKKKYTECENFRPLINFFMQTIKIFSGNLEPA